MFVKGNDGRASKKARDRQFANSKRCLVGLMLMITFAYYVWTDNYLNAIKHNFRKSTNRDQINSTPQIISAKNLERIATVLDGSVQLISIHVAKLVTKRSAPEYYDGIEAEFCAVDWKEYKQAPWKLPMYRDLLSRSENCRSGRIVVNLKELMEEVRGFDTRSSTRAGIKSLEPNFIFHESRCGSTLLANSIQYSNPDKNRVYTEAGPPLSALRICGENYEHCSTNVASTIFRDVIYLMGRVPSHSSESRLFFKMQAASAISIDIVQKTFPKAPWVFIYRDPVEVMVSHLNIPHMERAKCLQSRRHPPHRIKTYLDENNLSMKDMSQEEFCAMYLSSICQSILDIIQSSGSITTGKVLNYENVLGNFIELLPRHFQLILSSDEIRRMEFASTIYSKARDEDLKWTEDSQSKQDSASYEIHRASLDYLAFTYTQLETIKNN